MSAPRKPQLDELQRRRVEDARALLAIPAKDIPAANGVDPDNLALAYGAAYGRAKVQLQELLDIIASLTGGDR